jgi:hypothetical protein
MNIRFRYCVLYSLLIRFFLSESDYFKNSMDSEATDFVLQTEELLIFKAGGTYSYHVLEGLYRSQRKHFCFMV